MNLLKSHPMDQKVLDVVLFLVRIFIGITMLLHGYSKLQQLVISDEVVFYNFLGLGPKISLALTVFSEFVCSIFIILGLFTRFAALQLIITMLVAGLLVLANAPFEKKELSLIYLSVYVLIFFFGAGRFSIDHLITNKKHNY